MNGVAADLFCAPGQEYEEALEVDFTTHSGEVVILRGKAIDFGKPGVWIELGSGCEKAGLDAEAVTGILARCVLDGRIGSDRLRTAIELGWDVGSASRGGA